MQRKSTFILLMLCISSINLLCKKTESNISKAAFLVTEKTAITELSSSGTDTLKINSSDDWTIQSIPPFLNATVNNLDNQKELILHFSANEEVQTRSGEIIIKSNDTSLALLKISFTQAGQQPFISIDKTKLNEDSTGQLDSVVVQSNCNWEISVPSTSSWAIVDKVTGSAGNSRIHFSIAANSTNVVRSTAVTIASPGNNIPVQTIQLNQGINYHIDGFSPLLAAAGDAVIINGIFPAIFSVSINGITVAPESSSWNQIKLIVPADASTGKITVISKDVQIISANDLTINNSKGWIQVSRNILKGNSPYTYGISFVLNDKIYSGFGNDVTGHINAKDFQIFDPATGTWSQGPLISSYMHVNKYLSCFVCNNIAYMGSGPTNNLTDWWSYNPSLTDDAAWKEVASYYESGWGGVSFSINNTGYAGLLYNDRAISKFNATANNGTGTWTPVTNYFFPRLHYSSSLVINGYAYIIGGYDEYGKATSACFQFDPSSNNIILMASAPVSFAFAPSFSLNGKGYIIVNKMTYEFNPSTNSWKSLFSSPDIVGVYNAAVVKGVAYGWTTDGTVYQLKL